MLTAQISFKNLGHGSDCLECAFRLDPYPAEDDGYEDVEAAINETGNVILNIVQQVSIVFVGLAIFDYVYQWWDYEKNLRMSKQEVKEEYKQTEGDPKVKGQIKDRQQQMSRQRMMQNVPNADVVIRNPLTMPWQSNMIRRKTALRWRWPKAWIPWLCVSLR